MQPLQEILADQTKRKELTKAIADALRETDYNSDILLVDFVNDEVYWDAIALVSIATIMRRFGLTGKEG